jgi:hypothetical protein
MARLYCGPLRSTPRLRKLCREQSTGLTLTWWCARCSRVACLPTPRSLNIVCGPSDHFPHGGLRLPKGSSLCMGLASLYRLWRAWQSLYPSLPCVALLSRTHPCGCVGTVREKLLDFSEEACYSSLCPRALSSVVERFVHTCAVRGVPTRAGKTGGTGDKVSKASPYLETKVKGDRSMVRKGGRREVPESCPSANLYMAKPGLVEPNQSDLAKDPRHHGTIGRA